MASKMISTAEQDFLDQDPPIRGQKYVCMSFLSPEEVIAKKDAYFFTKFLADFSAETTDLWKTMLDVYKDNVEFTDSLRSIRNRYEHLFSQEALLKEYDCYLALNSEKLESEYLEKNDFQTSIRGIKVRGSYETLREAQIRAQVLKRLDDKFNVFIAEVGCWCPWSPNPEDIQNQEYAETQLNTLMHSYNENQLAKDQFYAQRKERMTGEQREKLKSNTSTQEKSHQEDVMVHIQDEDPWQKRKEAEQAPSESEGVPVPEAPSEITPALPEDQDAETPSEPEPNHDTPASESELPDINTTEKKTV